jgi:hypothetical protein
LCRRELGVAINVHGPVILEPLNADIQQVKKYVESRRMEVKAMEARKVVIEEKLRVLQEELQMKKKSVARM